jgi:hypothetical protein
MNFGFLAYLKSCKSLRKSYHIRDNYSKIKYKLGFLCENPFLHQSCLSLLIAFLCFVFYLHQVCLLYQIIFEFINENKQKHLKALY